MVKQFKIVLSHILDIAVDKPKFVELLTYVGSAVGMVNERPLVPLSDDPRDFTAIAPASLLTPYLDPKISYLFLHPIPASLLFSILKSFHPFSACH